MRLALGIFLSSCTLFGIAVARQGQSEPLAEQQFKNIQSFKGMKASDVIPAMEFMSASLKVDCDFCHTADRASDDKPEKRSARAMIAMQREINDKHFRGRNEVTCATCHGGREHPLSVPPVPGVELRARRANDVTADQVSALFAKGTGAAPAGAIRLSGMSTLKDETVKIDAVYAGDKFLVVRHTAKGDIKLGSNGALVWYAAPGFSTVIPPEAATRFKNQNTVYLSADSLPKLPNASAGVSKIADRDALVLSGGNPGSRSSFFVDKGSARLVRATYSYPSVLGSMIENTEFGNYRKVGNVQVPMTMTIHSGDGDEVRTFKSVKVDANVQASEFEPPKAG